jgi:uncharacterized protein YajQ (UPF0234 family)
MIEQTDLIVSKWNYQEPVNSIENAGEKLTSYITFDVMKKKAPTKKGIACRFTCEFIFEQQTVLEYVGEDSYVIDLEDVIDRNELHTMIRNSFSKFKEKFDLRKLGTVLHDKTLVTIDETKYDLGPVLALLN